MAGEDDLIGDDAGARSAAEEYARLQDALLAALDEFMDEEGLEDAEMIDLLVDAAIRLRMATYGAQIEKPSVAGLRLDLDRFRQEVDQIVREAKKSAEEFVALAKEARARQEHGPDSD